VVAGRANRAERRVDGAFVERLDGGEAGTGGQRRGIP
jgi:hypothetical protein